jgi:CRISPR-associated protein Cas1
MITRPSRLRLKDRALVVEQDDGTVTVPLEDMAVLLIEHQQVNLTAMLLSACAERQIAVITVDETHHPNGILLSHLPHSRAVKVMRAQIAMSQPRKKRLWQQIVKQKIANQSAVLTHHGHETAARRLAQLSLDVRSGDRENAEGQASQLYFPVLLGTGFSRKQSRFHNAALNYGYAIIRAAIARSLVAYGFLTAMGLHHHSEQNCFNLADDLIEPFRPLLDHYLLQHFPEEEGERLEPLHKRILVNILHQDISLPTPTGESGRFSLLSAVEAVVISLSQALRNDKARLRLPTFEPTDPAP